MLYILGGAPRAGKSILARQFVVKKQTPYLPLDPLITLLSKGFPKSGIKHLQPFIPKAKKLWPILKPFLLHTISEEPKYLIEGDAILPKFMPELLDEYREEVKVVFLGYAEITPKKKLAEMRKFGGQKDDWVQKQSDKFMLELIITMVEFSKYLKSECEKYGLSYLDVSTEFNQNLDKLLTLLHLKSNKKNFCVK